ncbi:MAG: two-component regulator propeller domain-containing protein [Bacteroidota bacterium]
MIDRKVCAYIGVLVLLMGPGGASGQHVFDALTVEDGIPHQAVIAIEQDSEGYLWFGTADGVSRYDGHRLLNFRNTPEDSLTLSGGRVNVLLSDGERGMWVGTQRGLSWINRETGKVSRWAGAPGQPDSSCDRIVVDMVYDSLGGLWVSTEGLTACYLPAQSNTFEAVQILDPSDRPRRARITQLPSGLLWINQAGYGERWGCVFDATQRSCIPETKSGRLMRWVGDDNRVWVQQPQDENLVPRMSVWSDGQIVTYTSSEATGTLQMFLMPGPGRLWIAEVRGIREINVQTGESTLLETGTDLVGLPGKVVHALFRDVRGDVWVGTDGGVGRLRPVSQQPFARFDSEFNSEFDSEAASGLSDPRINGVLVARDGTVWIGTMDGLNRLDPATRAIRSYRRPSVDAHTNAYWSIHEDQDGTLLVGTKRSGVLRFDPQSERFSRVVVKPSEVRRPEALSVRRIVEDSRGRVWSLSSQGTHVRLPDSDTFWPYDPQYEAIEFLRTSPVNTLYEDRSGVLWFGTSDGLCRLDERAQDARCFRPGGPGSITALGMWTMTETPLTPDTLWVGTAGGGLCRTPLSGSEFRCYTERDGLPNNLIYGILPDHTGRLWISTHRGLVRFDPRSEQFEVFTEADGLQSDAFDFMAYAKAPNGTMYFGGLRGLNQFHPDSVRIDTYVPPVRVSGFTLFGTARPRPVGIGDTLRLRHDENFFTIDLASLDYANPVLNQYRYRLVGYDNGWRTTTGQAATAVYTGVPPGRYTFELAGSNRDGVFGPDQEQIALWIRPAFWQTVWFRWGGGLLLIGLVGGAVWSTYRNRIQAYERQGAEEREIRRRLNESQERERGRIARELHDGPVQRLYTIGHELDMLDMEADPGTSVHDVREHVNTVMNELRDVVTMLRPTVVQHLGFDRALDALVRQYGRRHPDIEFFLDADPTAEVLDEQAEYALYRIINEALSNAIKHAAPSHVRITIRCVDSGVRLTVDDDGPGFTPPGRLIELARMGRFGLVGVRERVRQLDGALSVSPRPAGGTTFTVELPRSLPS